MSVFGNELMTASLGPPGVPKPLSAMTIGSLRDLGYETNGNVADAYYVSESTAGAGKPRSTILVQGTAFQERAKRARFVVTPEGVVTPIERIQRP